MRRLAEFVSVAPPKEKQRAGSDGVLVNAERSLERARWWPRFKEDLDVAGVTTPPVHIVAWTVLGTLVAAWLVALISGMPALGLLGLLLPLVVRSRIHRKRDRQRAQFAEQLPDNLQVLASALRAGHSLVGALSVVVDDAAEPSRSEFRRVVADEQLGVPLDEGLMVVARRMASRDLEQVALVAVLQHETGGNTAEVLDRVAETVRERFALRRLVKTLTAQGRMSRVIVSMLPVGLLALLTTINPEYMRPLYVNPYGRALLVIAGLMVLAGYWVIGRIVDIKV
jgi:tight adherence protein B